MTKEAVPTSHPLTSSSTWGDRGCGDGEELGSYSEDRDQVIRAQDPYPAPSLGILLPFCPLAQKSREGLTASNRASIYLGPMMLTVTGRKEKAREGEACKSCPCPSALGFAVSVTNVDGNPKDAPGAVWPKDPSP